MPASGSPQRATPARHRYVPAVGPRLHVLLQVVFALFALLSVNGLFLASVTLAGWLSGASYENLFYLYNFLAHLVLGFLLLVPAIWFGVAHIRNTRGRRNRRAVQVGYVLFAVTLLLLFSGVLLTRIEGVLVVKDATTRSVAYWIHVLTPLAAIWLFVLHRLAGKRIKWRIGVRWAAVGVVFTAASLVFLFADPRAWNVIGNPEGEKYFFPSLARTVTGDFIPERVLANDGYCKECHQDVHDGWLRSVHRFSSFNNPPYLASIRATRQAMLARDGNIRGARFCAGCHDPVPFFTGKFNDPAYDDVNDSSAHAGVTCTVCHAITHVNSPRGNGDYTIEEPLHYPFTFSANPVLRWVNRQLVNAKPSFHKKVFLKPLHKQPEFCGTCHKVHLPKELNAYKWLRGQNHYDSFLLSGVSGHGIRSFYYPQQAEPNCNDCHMPLQPSEDFGARDFDGSGVAKIHDHLFPSANTAIPQLAARLGRLSDTDARRTIEAHRAFNEGVMRVDLFGLRREGRVDGPLVAPLRPQLPSLQPGATCLLEVVIRTVKMGHLFTEGTADSNQVWLDVKVTNGAQVIGRSGGLDDAGRVDPWSHFVHAFVLDRDGNRIGERNAQDIFVPLYNNQIPPGAADTVHYRLVVPEGFTGELDIEVALRYRKFDTHYMRFVEGDPGYRNELPVLTLARDRVTLRVGAGGAAGQQPAPDIPEWQRWNDYGIGLLRKRGQGQLRQAEAAFAQVEALGRADGPLNRARVYLRDGRVAQLAPDALRRARDFQPPAAEWSLLWFSGLVAKDNGKLDIAIANFEQILAGGFAGAAGRGFDFRKDYTLRNELGITLYERSRRERGAARGAQRAAFLRRAAEQFQATLALDPENATAHYNLARVYQGLGDQARADRHAALHQDYRVDDNARDVAIAAARRKYPAANHAAEAVVIYDLMRPEAYRNDVRETDK